MINLKKKLGFTEEEKGQRKSDITEADSDAKNRSYESICQTRFSLEETVKTTLFEVPVTPVSTLFLKPVESPEYAKLNQNLQKVYEMLEEDCKVDKTSKVSEKVVKVHNTACSSLMMRRNRSEQTLRRANLL